MENKKYALIGRTLKHSYSKTIHAYLGDYRYDLIELESENLKSFLESAVSGFNVTIPYKREIIQYLDHVAKDAKDIGAVNTVVKKDGKSYGYNTDFLGMIFAIRRADIEVKGKVVMILGSGGTSQTAIAVAKSLGAKKIVIVSRSGEINYENYKEQKDVEIIINTTPVGMYPNTEQSPIDLDGFSKLSGVVDAVYNPSMTKLLYLAKEKGLKYTNGLPMLVAQAKYASELFTGKEISDNVIEKILSEIEKDQLNVLFIGMPGCGKSTIGKAIAKELGREFVDTDLLIEERAKMPIKEIFAGFGEDKFRELETEVIKDLGKESRKVISTGGGIVKRKENEFYIKRNSKVFYIKRSIDKLATCDRPLSKDLSAVKKLYEERGNLYEKLADKSIDNDGDIQDAIKGVIEEL